MECYESGAIPVREKCCENCAFRAGSPERKDGHGWIRLTEAITEGRGVFFCHKGIPGHPEGADEDLTFCRGWHVMKDKPEEMWELCLKELENQAGERDG